MSFFGKNGKQNFQTENPASYIRSWVFCRNCRAPRAQPNDAVSMTLAPPAGKNTTGRLWVAWQMVWPGRVLALYVLFYPFSKAVPGLFSCCGAKSLQAGNKFLHDCTFLLCPYVVQCIRIFMLLRRFG